LAYSLVEAEKTPDAIIHAIKAGRVEPVSQPLPFALLMRIFVGVAISKGPMWKKSHELMCIGGAFIKHVLGGRL
jgi:hypothetical protein